MSQAVRVFEVGPRDGLQNESRTVKLEDRIWFVRKLLESGIKDIECGAFVRSERVPQMNDSDRVFQAIQKKKIPLGKAHAWALIPNLKGLERALECGVKEIAVFTAATESFNQRNIGMSIAQSFDAIESIVREAKRQRITRIRGYVSTVFGCPFEGPVKPKKALQVIERLAELGVQEISIGDTIGVATPGGVQKVIQPALQALGKKRIAVHFHDTRGTALANTLRSLELGVMTVDSSAGGLGGCPFAPGATGNLATEDLVYMLDGMGVRTGIDLEKLSRTSLEFANRMSRPISSRYLNAFAAQCDT